MSAAITPIVSGLFDALRPIPAALTSARRLRILLGNLGWTLEEDPLVATLKAAGLAQYKLRRGKMKQWGTDTKAGAFGEILEAGTTPVDIQEEEVPSEGVVITRAWQSARNADGELLVWLGRKKKAGRGEARSGLRYDRILGTGGG